MHKIKTKASSNTCSAKKDSKGNPQQRRSQEYLSVKHRTTLLERVGLTSTKTRVSDASRQTECLSVSGCCQNASAHARGVIRFSEAAAAPESSWVE